MALLTDSTLHRLEVPRSRACVLELQGSRRKSHAASNPEFRARERSC
jgi:hypothetical protein